MAPAVHPDCRGVEATSSTKAVGPETCSPAAATVVLPIMGKTSARRDSHATRRDSRSFSITAPMPLDLEPEEPAAKKWVIHPFSQ